MNVDEDKLIDVNVKTRINQKLLILSLIGISVSILCTGFLLYFFSGGFIPTMSSLVVGIILVFFSIYFPLQSPQFLLVESSIVDIEEEELEELQSVMKPW